MTRNTRFKAAGRTVPGPVGRHPRYHRPDEHDFGSIYEGRAAAGVKAVF